MFDPIEKLKEFIRHQSISADSRAKEGMRGAQEFVAALLGSMGFTVEVVKTDLHPIILASRGGDTSWPHVIIYDVRDGVTPHRLADDPQEERRVFHVALTRCSQSVTVLSDAACSSRFLDEMDHEAGPEPERITRSRSSSPAPAAATSFNGDDALRDRLRAWRSDRAKADSVPAYVVFTNVTLDALADIAPTSLDELKRIPGIGPAKRERYGDAIVELIGAHVSG